MINAEVQKSGSESALSVIRKFSRRVQGTGLIKHSRDRRYFVRATSKTVQKKRALKRLKRRETYHEMVKEGKIIEQAPRRGRGGPRDAGTASQASASQTTAPATQGRSSGLGESTPIAR